MSTLKIKRENGKIFCPLADSWHIETPEEKVRQEYIKILVENYGYSLDQMAQEIKVNNSQRGQGKARADIVIWKSKQDKIESKAAFIVVECKAENVRIREEDYYQGYNYASWAGASFFVTTNEKETKYFNVDKDYLPKELVEVVAIPTAEEALNDKKVKDILSKTKTFTRDDFTKILRTCHNIIRNNDKLSPEAAFDEISKILFMKIKYEREQRGAKVFTKNEFVEKEKWFEKEIRPSLKGTPKDLPYMQFLFYNTKEEFKADQLFEENEIIKIRQNSFEQILEKLETYNLSDTQDDVKGIAFEQFLGTTFRGELGQYFTPRILSQTVRVPYDYIIYGKLRPYLNKYWENRSATKNVVCSSEFFVFDTKNINRIYFMEILSSTIIQEQLTPLYSGARMPRINESDFMGLKIPLPSPQKQQEIVDYISEVRRKIATLQLQIPLHSQRAKKEFEEAVFGEAQKRIY